MSELKFSPANSKLRKLSQVTEQKVYSLDLQSGASCPSAADCKSIVKIDNNGKTYVKDGPHCKFRCFSASQEALYPSLFKMRQNNLQTLRKAKTVTKMVSLIIDTIPPKANIIRLHVGGDFFSQKYFDAIIQVIRLTPNIKWYTYTKALPYWVVRINSIPENLSLIASSGGRYDHLIKEYNLPFVEVVYSPEQAALKNLPLDHNDKHALEGWQHFALLIHGIQPKDSQASKAVYDLKKRGILPGYSRKQKG